jgi:hypothetical protein
MNFRRVPVEHRRRKRLVRDSVLARSAAPAWPRSTPDRVVRACVDAEAKLPAKRAELDAIEELLEG